MVFGKQVAQSIRILFQVALLANLLGFQAATAQPITTVVDNDSVETKEELHDAIIAFVSTLEFESCADIGSGNLELILKISDALNDKSYVFEDIDTGMCNKTNMLAKIQELHLTQIDISRISIHIGDVHSTGLPDHQFDVVLMSGLIHEIDDRDLFFSDLRRILKPDGTIVLSDAFYDSAPKPHQGCNNPFLTHKELDQLLVEQGLTILKEWQKTGIKTESNGSYTSRIIQCAFE